jgi:nucleoid-associated protein YgaU
MMTETNLQIKAYDRPSGARTQGQTDIFTVDFNPNTFTLNHKIDYTQTQGKGQVGNDPVFEKIPALEFSLEFTIDGTGVAMGNLSPAKKSNYQSNKADYVKSQVRILKDVAGLYLNAEIHRPNYLLVLWGTLSIDCVMTALNITYNLFDPQGVPLRAKINCSFLQRLRPGEGSRGAMLESSDLTKQRLVQEGDLLPLLAKENYQASDYYLQLARVNKLKNFRNIPPGTTLILPPMTDTDE